MTAKVIASIDLDEEVTLQLQLMLDDGAIVVSCGAWCEPIDRVHSAGAQWVEENLAASNLAPALLVLDFFADFAKAISDRAV